MKATKDMTIAKVLQLDAGVSNILFACGMHCLGCMMASGESLSEAALVHGVDADDLIIRINEHLASK